jgi:hypothetical protein
LELTDTSLARRCEDIQAHARGSNRGEAVDALVADIMTFNNGLPVRSIPGLYTKMFDVLTFIEPLHDEALIESHGRLKIEFQNGMI